MSELIDFAEAAAPFMDSSPGRLLRITPGFAFSADRGHTWAAVERIRLREDELEEAIAAVDELLHEGRNERASWWLTERSTPSEEVFIAAGLRRDESDYLHAAMVLTSAPPPVDGIEARLIETFEEYAEARRLAADAFSNPHERDPTDAELAADWEQQTDPVFAAWLDGRMASVGRAIYTRVGAYLMGGSTATWARGRGAYRAVVRARWDEAVRRGTPALAVGAGSMSRPILERLGFEQVLQFRRLESVRSDS